MSKMTPKFLLTNFTVVRNGVRKTLPGNSTGMLTKPEIALLDKLTQKTGRAHYRDPRNEMPVEDDTDLDITDLGDKIEDDDDDETETEAETEAETEGPDVDAMTVKELKAYLDAEPATEYSASADKPTLLGLARVKKAAAADANGGL